MKNKTMCDSIKILSKVKSGELSVCRQCRMYHLEFNNIYLEFSEEEFEKFKSYILDIDINYWEHKYACAKIKRKIPIPSMQQNLVLIFNQEEINELTALLFYSSYNVFEDCITPNDIDYKLVLN